MNLSTHNCIHETFQLHFSVALKTLSKLGSKVEELMERNRCLGDPSDAKSEIGRHGVRNYSGGQSLHGQHGDRVSNDERGREIEEVCRYVVAYTGKRHNTTQSEKDAIQNIILR